MKLRDLCETMWTCGYVKISFALTGKDVANRIPGYKVMAEVTIFGPWRKMLSERRLKTLMDKEVKVRFYPRDEDEEDSLPEFLITYEAESV